MEIYIDMDQVDQDAVDEAVLAMVKALAHVDVAADEAIVALGEIFRMILEEDVETIH